MCLPLKYEIIANPKMTNTLSPGDRIWDAFNDYVDLNVDMCSTFMMLTVTVSFIFNEVLNYKCSANDSALQICPTQLITWPLFRHPSQFALQTTKSTIFIHSIFF